MGYMPGGPIDTQICVMKKIRSAGVKAREPKTLKRYIFFEIALGCGNLRSFIFTRSARLLRTAPVSEKALDATRSVSKQGLSTNLCSNGSSRWES